MARVPIMDGPTAKERQNSATSAVDDGGLPDGIVHISEPLSVVMVLIRGLHEAGARPVRTGKTGDA
jgi:hypothetical protein